MLGVCWACSNNLLGRVKGDARALKLRQRERGETECARLDVLFFGLFLTL